MVKPDQVAWKTPAARPWAENGDAELQRRTRALAEGVARRLPQGHSVIIRTPLVIGGNLTPDALSQWHRKTIAPAMESMRCDYLATSMPHPIAILLFKDEASYRHAAENLLGEHRGSIYGFFQPYSRTVVINLAAGGGTIIHELTHAVLDYDFPEVPIWFNEGLASLHEHCDLEVQDGRSVIVPRLNWRLAILQTALVEGRMLPTWEMMQKTRFDGRDEALLYAHARYFCFYLREQGKLKDFYSCFRDQHQIDKYGNALIRQFLPGKTWPQIERDFRTWVLEHHIPVTRDATGKTGTNRRQARSG